MSLIYVCYSDGTVKPILEGEHVTIFKVQTGGFTIAGGVFAPSNKDDCYQLLKARDPLTWGIISELTTGGKVLHRIQGGTTK